MKIVQIFLQDSSVVGPLYPPVQLGIISKYLSTGLDFIKIIDEDKKQSWPMYSAL